MSPLGFVSTLMPSTRQQFDARSMISIYLRKEYPTLDKILHSIRGKGVFQGGRWCLWKLLHSMGFSYSKRKAMILFTSRQQLLSNGISTCDAFGTYELQVNPLSTQ